MHAVAAALSPVWTLYPYSDLYETFDEWRHWRENFFASADACKHTITYTQWSICVVGGCVDRCCCRHSFCQSVRLLQHQTNHLFSFNNSVQWMHNIYTRMYNIIIAIITISLFSSALCVPIPTLITAMDEHFSRFVFVSLNSFLSQVDAFFILSVWSADFVLAIVKVAVSARAHISPLSTSSSLYHFHLLMLPIRVTENDATMAIRIWVEKCCHLNRIDVHLRSIHT